MTPVHFALLGAAGGALLAFLVLFPVFRSRAARERLDSARREAALQEAAEAERARRTELEAVHREVEAARWGLESRLAVARRDVENAETLLREQKSFLETSKREFENAFKALAAEALKGNSEQFLDLAGERLGKIRTEANSDLEERKKAIETLLDPLRETLGKLEARTGEIEKAREGAYARIGEQVRLLAEATSGLQERTSTLTGALQGSQVRGRWGELALQRIVELAGMTEHCDFDLQVQLEDGRRPDMVVRLPEGRKIAVDAKAPLGAYLEAVEAETDAGREAALKRHVRALRRHTAQLAAREYAEELGSDLDLVVLFLPGDPFLAAAFAKDPDLQVDALRSKVLLATPTTLVALLRTVAIYWQQLSMAENAERIADTARILHERTRIFAGHLAAMGRDLQGAVKAYNKAVGSFETRLIPMARKLEELQVKAKEEIAAPPAVEEEARHADKPRVPEQETVPFLEE